MEPLTPFAYGTVANVLVATDDRWVCVSGVEDDTPLWGFEAAAPVAGVRNTRAAILAVDVTGQLTRLAHADGKVLDRTTCGVAATGLAATADRAWAVLHTKGVRVRRSAGQQFNVNVRAAACVALDECGSQLAVGSREGVVHALNLESGKSYNLDLKLPISGVAWSGLGWWFINTPHALYRADADLGLHRKLCDWNKEAAGWPPLRMADCAVRLGTDRVVVVGAGGDALGEVRYLERLVGEIEFGPFPWLGIGIGQGDGNRLSLVEAEEVYRTDPPPGRPRNSWKLIPGINGKRVLREQVKHQVKEPASGRATSRC